MPVKCKICNAEFPKLISSTHLKTHNVSSLEYKVRFGAKALASDEYRQQRSANNLGENNPNYGNIMQILLKNLYRVRILEKFRGTKALRWRTLLCKN